MASGDAAGMTVLYMSSSSRQLVTDSFAAGCAGILTHMVHSYQALDVDRSHYHAININGSMGRGMPLALRASILGLAAVRRAEAEQRFTECAWSHRAIGQLVHELLYFLQIGHPMNWDRVKRMTPTPGCTPTACRCSFERAYTPEKVLARALDDPWDAIVLTLDVGGSVVPAPIVVRGVEVPLTDVPSVARALVLGGRRGWFRSLLDASAESDIRGPVSSAIQGVIHYLTKLLVSDDTGSLRVVHMVRDAFPMWDGSDRLLGMGSLPDTIALSKSLSDAQLHALNALFTRLTAFEGHVSDREEGPD